MLEARSGAEEPKKHVYGDGGLAEPRCHRSRGRELQGGCDRHVQCFREGLSFKITDSTQWLWHRDDIDWQGESWVSGVVGMEARLKLSSDRIS